MAASFPFEWIAARLPVQKVENRLLIKPPL
jgi:hypothetical protein